MLAYQDCVYKRVADAFVQGEKSCVDKIEATEFTVKMTSVVKYIAVKSLRPVEKCQFGVQTVVFMVVKASI